ncbi:helix-turn-helix domain-containing protein [Herbidospora sp. RD11066]
MLDRCRCRPTLRASFAGGVRWEVGIGPGRFVGCRAALSSGPGGSRRQGCEQDGRRGGVSRHTLHSWLRRYRESGLAGLADRSRRPLCSPSRLSAQVEAVVCELRREHLRWGSGRLVREAARLGVDPPPSRMAVYRALVRHGLISPRAGTSGGRTICGGNGRRRCSCGRWTSSAGL